MVVGYLNSLLLKSIRSWLFGICDILRRRASPDKTTNRAEKIEKEERVQVVSHVHGKTFPYNHLGFKKATKSFKERMIDLPGSHLPVFFIHRDLDRLCTLEYVQFFLKRRGINFFIQNVSKRGDNLLLTASLSGSFSIMLEQI